MNYSAINVYATTTCPYCNYLGQWLDKHAISYNKILIDTDEKRAREIIAKTGQMGVPITEITYPNRKAEYIVGFDPAQLSYMLGIS